MIEDSDDDAATSLWNEIGGAPAISRYDDLVGLGATVPNTEGYWGETMTTALDQVELLKRLVFANPVLDDASRAYELDLMRHVIPLDSWGITTGPTSTTLVAVKNGWVPIVSGNWQINSIGYVTGDGRSYVLAVLTNENPSEYNGIETIDGISSPHLERAPRHQRPAVGAMSPTRSDLGCFAWHARPSGVDPRQAGLASEASTPRPARVRAPIAAPTTQTPRHFADAYTPPATAEPTAPPEKLTTMYAEFTRLRACGARR